MSSQKITQIEFTGKTTEYFGIWIVNLLLTILTLGIYSAWAKVRRKKYFYNNTLIDNVGFDYHAKPITILKGRIIAFVFFIGYAFGGQIHPFVSVFFVILFFLALPWLVVRSSLFNARNTSHRGLRFDFVGKLSDAIRVFMLLPIATVVTLGLVAPYVAHQKNKFMVNGHKFGSSQFDMQAKVGGFYKVYLKLFIVPVIIGILAAIAIPAYQGYLAKSVRHSTLSVPNIVGFTSVQTSQPIVLAVNELEQNVERVERVYSENAPSEQEVATKNMQEEGLTVDPSQQDTTTMSDKEFEEMVKELERTQAQQEAPTHRSWQDAFGTAGLFGMLAMFVGILLYALFIFGIVGYLKARISNLVWNNTTIDHLSFKSNLRARDYIWIYFTNIVAIVMTFGLATPWAQVRLARYRVSKLQIVGDVEFDKFVGDKKEAVKATGEEIADFFDADFSFG